MAIEQREGVLDQVTEKGILLSGQRLSYSKWFEGDRPTEDALGRTIRVIVDVGDKCTFFKKIVRVGEKANGWNPPEPGNRGSSGGGGGRRFSPEEVDLKREEGVRIARSVAIDRAITMAREGVAIEKVAPLAAAVEEYILTGKLPISANAPMKEPPQKDTPKSPPTASPTPPAVEGQNPGSAGATPKKTQGKPSTPAKPKRLASQAVNALFNEAKRGGLVADWNDYLMHFQNVLKVVLKSPYHLSVEDFIKVESHLRSKLRGAA